MLSGKSHKTSTRMEQTDSSLSQLNTSYGSPGPERGKYKEESLEQEIDCSQITSPP